jgi:hypothetical protein
MNITIKITHINGTVMDISIPVAIEQPVPVEVPQPAVVVEESPAMRDDEVVTAEDLKPSGKRYKSVQEMVEANAIYHGPEVLESLIEALKDEPEQPQDTGEQFRCTDGFYAIPPNLYSDFCAAFGQTMVDQQLTLARLWVETNPPKRKTRRGMGRFLNAWMCRAQGEKRQPLKGRSGSLLEANNTSSQGW